MSYIINPYRFAAASGGSMPSTFDLLIVAGGGGGGDGQTGVRWGGCGGAGGYRMFSGISNDGVGSYQITVGAGGADNTSGSDSAVIGPDTLWYSATGGGYGARKTAYTGNDAASGGSGGGGCHGSPVDQDPGSGNDGGYTPVEGYDGAVYNSTSDPPWSGGYGGGGGSSGDAGSPNYWSAGPGTSNSISGSATTYATGGSGDGAGDDNTGDGGQGGYPTGDSGGSGVVIIKYSSSGLSEPTWDDTTAPDDLSAGGYYIYRWTGDGTMVWASS